MLPTGGSRVVRRRSTLPFSHLLSHGLPRARTHPMLPHHRSRARLRWTEAHMSRKLIPALILVALLVPASLFAAAITKGGPRVGFSADPDQIVFGGQLEIGDVAPKVTFDPNLELGFGDDRSVIAVNFD